MPSIGVSFKEHVTLREAFGSMKNESSNPSEDEKSTYENKFELIAIASRRARNLREGKKKLIEGVSDKEPVVALNELLSGRLKFEIVRKNEDGISES